MEQITLTSKEVSEAIINYIGIFKKGKSFFPYKIIDSTIPIKLPNNITFDIEYIPKGTKSIKDSGL